ncbi:MAG: monooxygenase, partial [bacterium]
CIDKARDAGDFFENCTPGYYNNEGQMSQRSVQNGFYGGGSVKFFQVLEDWRQAGGLEGLELS